MTPEGEKKKAYILREGVYVSTPLGDSMRPMLRGQRDSVAVKAVTRPVQKGDVLLYETADGRHVLHRVIGVTEAGYRVRGDNCFGEEPTVTDGQIIGILVGFWRKGKYCICESHRPYRRYVKFWLWSFPLRRFCRRVKNKCKRVLKMR